LLIEGEVDLRAIRGEARKEGYRVSPDDETVKPGRGLSRTDWNLIRTVTAGILLLAAFVAQGLDAESAVYLSLFIGAIILGGFSNFIRAAHSIVRLDFNMSVLMSIAVTGAAFIGAWQEAAVVAFLFSVSDMLDSWTLDRARRSIRQLMEVAPRTARVERDGETVEVDVEDVVPGDVVLVRPGEKIAVDGVIISGSSALDEASITGESVPAEKGPGDEVFAGTLNGGGLIRAEVTRLVGDTTIAKIVEMVEEAQGRRAPSQAFVDKFAAVYTPVVIALAAAIVLVPPLLAGQPWEPWVYRGLALLVVACPCALVVSTPIAIVSAISNAAHHGVLIKGGVYLEQMGAIGAVAFDKTGTLTAGRPAVTDVIPLDSISEEDLLQLAASLEAGSEHPLARAIVQAAEERSIELLPISSFEALAGLGARATIDGDTVVAGSARFLETILSLQDARSRVDALQAEGKTVVLIASGERLRGAIGIADEVRASSKDAVTALRGYGVEHTVMLTGDNETVAAAISRASGVQEYRAGLLPQDKVSAVNELLAQYGTVAMVGDGVNDAPALATATVGIAMGGAGSDTALETADVALMADDLSRLPFTVSLSTAALRLIKINIAFALTIKLLAVLAVFPGWLTLWLAILSDMGATIIVTLNGMRLLRWREPQR
jgi:Cd2+/Zn2+-exporting ATPase